MASRADPPPGLVLGQPPHRRRHVPTGAVGGRHVPTGSGPESARADGGRTDDSRREARADGGGPEGGTCRGPSQGEGSSCEGGSSGLRPPPASRAWQPRAPTAAAMSGAVRRLAQPLAARLRAAPPAPAAPQKSLRRRCGPHLHNARVVPGLRASLFRQRCALRAPAVFTGERGPDASTPPAGPGEEVKVNAWEAPTEISKWKEEHVS